MNHGTIEIQDADLDTISGGEGESEYPQEELQGELLAMECAREYTTAVAPVESYE
ncbi:hypothetical protein AB0D49_39345 [Streptomyces sp. NPDC048290]|uniref:hypothetical protein n=1 Tax=Streptomyces sp. NPDC048290 TaxID=3155811 RepID=UPI00341915F0